MCGTRRHVFQCENARQSLPKYIRIKQTEWYKCLIHFLGSAKNELVDIGPARNMNMQDSSSILALQHAYDCLLSQVCDKFNAELSEIHTIIRAQAFYLYEVAVVLRLIESAHLVQIRADVGIAPAELSHFFMTVKENLYFPFSYTAGVVLDETKTRVVLFCNIPLPSLPEEVDHFVEVTRCCALNAQLLRNISRLSTS